MTYEHGRVHAVYDRVLGDELAQDESAGASTLHLHDVSAFLEEGGTVRLSHSGQADEMVGYTGLDDDADTLALAGATAATWSRGSRVHAEPRTVERRALVLLDDAESVDEMIDVRVQHALRPMLPEGVRDI